MSESDVFPLNHMSLHKRSDHPEAGPSLEETLTGLSDALVALDALVPMAKCDESAANLDRDMRRLAFGVDMTRLLYLASLVKVDEATDSEMTELRELAERMHNDREVMSGYDHGANFDNALSASWIEGSINNILSGDTRGADKDGIAL